MPCADCLEQQKILIRLTAALNDREQQNQELSGKFHKYKLQTKAKFAQLRHQILENVGNEDTGNTNRLSTLLLRLDETDGQLSQFKDQIDSLKVQLERKDKEKADYENQIKNLQQKLNENSPGKRPSNRKNDSATTSDDDVIVKSAPANQSAEQIQQMYAQMVYKDSKILELSRQIDEEEQKIMDLQEACRERDEVNKAKTKAIQILQEQLSRHINVKRKDQATETDASSEQQMKANQTTSSNTSPMPGRAVAFYKDQLKKDDEDSSFTTDLTANDIESSDLLRGDMLSEGKNIDKLNSRLSGLLQQVESMQKRVIKNELIEFESSQAANQPVLVKKKKDKKVTFDFSEQQRLSEIEDLKEKLQKSDLACNDLRDENDELRITIADLEQRLDERIAKNEYYEKLCSDLELRLENGERQTEVLTKQLEDAKKDAKTSVLKTKAQQTSKIKELEEEVFLVQTELSEKISIVLEFETQTSDLKEQLSDCKEDNLRLQSSLQSLQNELALKSDELKSLENRSDRLSLDNESLSKTLDELKREQKNQIFKAKAHLSVRIKELEEALNQSKVESSDEMFSLKQALNQAEERESKSQERETQLRRENDTLRDTVSFVSNERDTFLKQKEDIIRDFDQLKEIIETSQELIDFLESDLDLSYAEAEELRRQLEFEPSDVSAKVRDSTEQRLRFKAYLAKLKSLQKDNERLEEDLACSQEKCERVKNEKYLLSLDLENLRSLLDLEKRKRDELEETYSDVYTVYERANVDSKSWFEKIAQLQETVERSKLESSNLSDQLRHRDETLSSLRQQSESFVFECENLKKQNKFLLDEKQEIENELQKLWHHDTSMKKHLADLQTQYEDLNKEKILYFDKCANYEEQLQQFVAKLQILTKENDTFSMENAKLKDQVTFFESNLNVKTSSFMKQISSLKTSANRSDDEMRSLLAENDQLRADLKDLSEDKKSLECKLQSSKVYLDQEHQKYATEKCALESSLQSKIDECKQFELQLQSVQLEFSKENSGSKKIEEQMVMERDNLFELLDVEQSARNIVEQQLENQSRVVQSLTDQLTSFKEKFRLSEIREEEISTEKNNYEEQLAVLIVEKAQTDNACLRLTEQLDAAQTEIARLSALSTSSANFESQIKLLESERDYVIQEHCSTIDNLKSLNEELQSKLEMQDSKLSVLSAEISELRSNIDEFQRQSEFEVSTSAPSLDKDERDSLYEHIKSIQTMCDTFKQDNERLSDERQTLCNEIGHLNHMLRENQIQMDAQKIAFDDTSRSVEEVKKENENLKEQLSVFVQTNTDLHATDKEKREYEIVLLKSEVIGLNQHISTLVKQVDDYQLRLRQSQERTVNDGNLEKLQNELRETLLTDSLLKEEIFALKRLCQNFDAEKLDVCNRLRSSEQELASFKSRLQESESERLSLLNQVDVLVPQQNALQQRLFETIAKSEHQDKLHQERLKQLEIELQDHATNVQSKSDQSLLWANETRRPPPVATGTNFDENSTLQRRSPLSQIVAESGNVEEDVGSCLLETVELTKLESNNLRDQLLQREEMLTSLRQQNEAFIAEFENLKKQKKFLLDEKQEIENELQKLSRQDSSTKKQLIDLQAQFENVNKDKIVYHDKCSNYEEQLQQFVAKMQILTQENAKLKDQFKAVESLKSSLDRSDNENRSLLIDNDRLRADLRDLNESKKDLEQLLHQEHSEHLDQEHKKIASEKCAIESLLQSKTDEYKQLELRLEFVQLEFNNQNNRFKEIEEQLLKEKEQMLKEKDNFLKLLDVEQSARNLAEQQLEHQIDVVQSLTDQLISFKEKFRLSATREEQMSIDKNNFEQQLTVEKTQADNACLILKEQLAVAEMEIAKLSALSASSANFESQVKLLESERDYIIQEHCSTIDNLRSLNEELQSKLALKDSKLAVLSAEISEQRSKIDALHRQSEYEVSTSASSVDKDERNSLYERIKSVQTMCDTLKQDKQRLSDERQTLCNEIIHLNNLLTEGQNQIEAQKIVVDGMSESIDEVIKENENLKDQLGVFIEANANLHATDKEKREHEIVLKSEVDNLNQQVSSLLSQVDDYKLKLRKSQERTTANDGNLDKLEKELREALRSDAMLKEEICALKRSCQSFQAEKLDICNRLHSSEQELVSLKSRLHECESERLSSLNHIDVLKRQQSALQQRLSETLAKSEQLSLELENFHQERSKEVEMKLHQPTTNVQSKSAQSVLSVNKSCKTPATAATTAVSDESSTHQRRSPSSQIVVESDDVEGGDLLSENDSSDARGVGSSLLAQQQYQRLRSPSAEIVIGAPASISLAVNPSALHRFIVWLKRRSRLYVYQRFSLRRLSPLKILVFIYLLMIHLFILECWLR